MPQGSLLRISAGVFAISALAPSAPSAPPPPGPEGGGNVTAESPDRWAAFPIAQANGASALNEHPRDIPPSGSDGVAEMVTFALATPRKSTTTGAMDDVACNRALKKLGVPHMRAPTAARIEQPIVLTGPIAGVHFDTGRPYAQRNAASGDAIDCRLAVALVELAKVVKRHGVAAVVVKSLHRPNQKIVDSAAPLRHRVGFAIDISAFKTSSGEVWTIRKDFHGKVGEATCGAGAATPSPDTKVARALWATFCEIVATEAFDSGISPNFNAAHYDHLHFDLTHDHPTLFFP